MNDGGFTHNSAADSTVGIQAETVHNSNVYFVHPDASPQEKYRVGVRFLEDGVPSRARDMISDAIAHGYNNATVRFHWVLSMLSARAYHELSTANGETGRVLERLRALSPHHRDAILHHLGHVLTGGLKDSLWVENRERVEAARFQQPTGPAGLGLLRARTNRAAGHAAPSEHRCRRPVGPPRTSRPLPCSSRRPSGSWRWSRTRPRR